MGAYVEKGVRKYWNSEGQTHTKRVFRDTQARAEKAIWVSFIGN